MALRWREVERVRAFLAAVDAAMPEALRSERFTAWLVMARNYVAEFDPLANLDTIAKDIKPPTNAG